MGGGCGVYVCADSSSVVCAENVGFIPRIRLRKHPRSVDCYFCRILTFLALVCGVMF